MSLSAVVGAAVRRTREREAYFADRQNCECHGCNRIATRFVGSKGGWWLRFCSLHKDVAYTLNEYTRTHPNVRRKVVKHGF